MAETEIPQDVLDALNKHFELIGVTTKIPSVLAYEVWNIIASADPASRAPDRDVLVEALRPFADAAGRLQMAGP